jgi:hypothetical protein
VRWGQTVVPSSSLSLATIDTEAKLLGLAEINHSFMDFHLRRSNRSNPNGHDLHERSAPGACRTTSHPSQRVLPTVLRRRNAYELAKDLGQVLDGTKSRLHRNLLQR